MEPRDREHIRDIKRLRDISLPLHLAHANRVAPDVIGVIPECLVRPINHG